MTKVIFREDLSEYNVFDDVVVTESEIKGRKYRVVEGTAAKTNIVNRNNRLYKESIYDATLNRYVGLKLKANKYLGELEHPEEVRTSLHRAAVKFTEVWREGDLIKYKGIILPTPSGKILESLLEAGVAVGVSTRGYGSYKLEEVNGKKVEVIQEDYTMTGIDFVLDESNPYGAVNKFESVKGGNNVEITTIDQLKAHFPELTSQLVEAAKLEGATAKENELKESHETAIATAKVDAVNEYKQSDEAKKYEVAFNSMVEAMKPHLPETVRIAESELGQEVTQLRESVSTLETAKKDAEVKLQLAENKLSAIEAKEKVATLVESKVKGHKYETQLRTRLMEAKSEEDVETMFTKEVAFLESVFAGNPAPAPAGNGIVNEGANDPEPKPNPNPQPLNESMSKLARLAGLGKK